jgi:hypothetical protein
MSIGAYLLGMASLLVFGGALAVAAIRLRALLIPEWSGARARLVEATLGLSLLVGLAELLGLLGLLREGPLLVGAVAIACAAWFGAGRAGGRPRPAAPRLPSPGGRARGIAIAIGLVVVGAWSLGTLKVLDEGIWAFDATWYHMPLAAGFAQSGSVTSINFIDPLSLARFYPANSELIHGVGIAILQRDLLSPILSLAWLSLAMLAAWSIGRPYRVAPITLLAVGVLLVAHSFTSRQPGNAMSDIATMAMLLTSAAILVNAFGPGSRWGNRPDSNALGPILVAALAAGLAGGTKLNLLAPVVALAVAIVLATKSGSRSRVAAVWLGGAFATGGYWYVRNLIATGNPLPWFKLGIGSISLPSTPQVEMLRPDFSVAHYLTDVDVWGSFFGPGLAVSFGDLWPLLIVLALTGAVAGALGRLDPIRRVLGAAALAGVVAYLFTPLSAGGYDGSPAIFATNLRWVVPFLALGAALLATGLPTVSPRMRMFVIGALALLFALNVAESSSLTDPHLPGSILVAVGAGAALLGVLALTHRIQSPIAIAAGLGVVIALGAGAYWPFADHYVRDRYADLRPGTHLTSSFSWAKGVRNARIGLAGTTAAFFQYPYYGDDVSNAVRYIARHGTHGSFTPIDECAAWRTAVNRGRFTYLVTTPRLNPVNLLAPRFSPERAWARSDSATTTVLRDGPVAVYRVNGRLHPGRCARDDPIPETSRADEGLRLTRAPASGADDAPATTLPR